MDAETGGLRVVVVNHNGGTLLARCVDHVLGVEWSGRFELVIVDNASTDGSLDVFEGHHHGSGRTPQIIALDSNTGFGANNEALADLDGIDWVALVNPDAFVPSSFAVDLVAAFTGPTVGAVSPKIVFDDLFISLHINADAKHNVRLTRVEVDGHDVTDRTHVTGRDAARLPTPRGSQWHLGDHAEVMVPVSEAADRPAGKENPPSSATLFLTASTRGAVVARAQSGAPVAASVSGDESAVVVPLPSGSSAQTQRIQNAGSWVDTTGLGGNRGFLEPDDPGSPFSEPTEVFAWCGAAVMLRADYLRDVGLFEPDFFLYYEDTDLSWRGQSRGWTYRYEPSVTVRHRHSASTGQGSATTDIFQQRNRLRLLARNASLPVVARGVVHSVGAAGKIGVRKLTSSTSPGSKGDSTLFGRRARGIVAAATDLPGSFAARRTLSKQRQIDRSEVEAKLQNARRR